LRFRTPLPAPKTHDFLFLGNAFVSPWVAENRCAILAGIAGLIEDHYSGVDREYFSRA